MISTLTVMISTLTVMISTLTVIMVGIRMGRWKIHYYKQDQTEVTIEFKTEKQARRYAEKHVIRHPDEINPPDVYESEDDSDVEREKLAKIAKPLQASRKQRLRELLIKWNRVYS